MLVEAEVPDTSRLYVDVGLGFHVELQRAEALHVAAERQALAQVRCDYLLQQYHVQSCRIHRLCGLLQEQLQSAERALQKAQSAVWLARQGLLDLRQSIR